MPASRDLSNALDRRLRIALVAPPMERVPPRAYGGTERVVHELATELDRRGHMVTTFASGDSAVPGRLVTTAPQALRPAGYTGDPGPYIHQTMRAVLDRTEEFDIIHGHLEWANLLLAQVSRVPVVSTFHGRLDVPWASEMFHDPPAGLVAISRNQASTHPSLPWAGVVHNGLTFPDVAIERPRGDALCFVGRMGAEKGIVEAIHIARAVDRPLRIAAKLGRTTAERDYYHDVFAPALKAAGSLVEFLGEVEQAERDILFAESYAALMPGSWPEPFGLVAIEALACGTPVIARDVGGLPEIIRQGVDGYLGADIPEIARLVGRVDGLDRTEIRRSVRQRFSAARMTDGYEAIYRTIAGSGSRRRAHA